MSVDTSAEGSLAIAELWFEDPEGSVKFSRYLLHILKGIFCLITFLESIFIPCSKDWDPAVDFCFPLFTQGICYAPLPNCRPLLSYHRARRAGVK